MIHRYRKPNYQKMAEKDMPSWDGNLGVLFTDRDLEMGDMSPLPKRGLRHLLPKPLSKTAAEDREISAHLLSEEEDE